MANRGHMALFLLMAVLLVLVLVLSGCVGMKEITINNIDLSQVGDGKYEGTYDGGLVKATVSVVVSGHKITKLEILNHDNGKGEKAESIVDSIVAKQSLGVDAVTGATYSSRVILKATEIALQQGVTTQSREGTVE